MLGIDVSKDTLACALLDPQTRATLWEKSVPNTAAGVKQLLEDTPPSVRWVAEPTGRFSLTMVKQAREAGREVLLAPPRKAQAYLRSIQTRAKTDRLDSRGLGLYALAVPLKPYPVKSEVAEHLDQLLRARRGITDAITSLKLRIEELPAAAEPLQKAVQDLKRQQAALERQIEKWIAQHEEFTAVARLLEVPSIGLITAATAVSRLQDKQFEHPDAFVAYIGLDVKIQESGKRKGELGLSKEGDAELRRLFYCCAQSTLRKGDNPFKAQYERERKKGMPTTAALNAVARKLARLCWSMVRHGTSYDPDRIYERPISRKTASELLDNEP
jgi:transposase